jgi:hypothetical protein
MLLHCMWRESIYCLCCVYYNGNCSTFKIMRIHFYDFCYVVELVSYFVSHFNCLLVWETDNHVLRMCDGVDELSYLLHWLCHLLVIYLISIVVNLDFFVGASFGLLEFTNKRKRKARGGDYICSLLILAYAY